MSSTFDFQEVLPVLVHPVLAGSGAHEFHRHLLRPETGDMKVEVEGAEISVLI